MATGVLSLELALAGFVDPTVMFIASLFGERGPRRNRSHRVGTAGAGRSSGGSRARVLILMLLLSSPGSLR